MSGKKDKEKHAYTLFIASLKDSTYACARCAAPTAATKPAPRADTALMAAGANGCAQKAIELSEPTR